MRTMLAGCGCAFLLAGCGWHAVYAPAASGAPAAAQRGLAEVTVAPIADRPGQLLRLALQDRFGRFGLAEAHKYDLVVSLSINGEPIAIQTDNTSTITRLIGTANWSLLAETPQRNTVTSGFARDVDDYNIADQQYFAADLENQTVSRRITDALADRITEQLSAYFDRQERRAANP